MGSNQRAVSRRGRIAKGTLPFRSQGLTDVREEAGIGRAELGVMRARLIQTKLAVDGETHFPSVVIFLSVILPPADRAQLQGAGCFEGFISATGTTITDVDGRTHGEMGVGITGAGKGLGQGKEIRRELAVVVIPIVGEFDQNAVYA